MPEAFSFREGALHVWTGAATASGSQIGYARNIDIQLNWNFEAEPNLSGQYRTHLAGQNASISIETIWTYSSALRVVAMAATAGGVHFKITHSGVHGSGGIILYSGSIRKAAYVGGAGEMMQYRIEGMAHAWSAF